MVDKNKVAEPQLAHLGDRHPSSVILRPMLCASISGDDYGFRTSFARIRL